MKNQQPQPIYLKDYKPSSFNIDNIELFFDLSPQHTRVKAVMSVHKNAKTLQQQADLVLDGEKLKLIYLAINNNELGKDGYKIDEEHLTLYSVPQQFELTIITEINPQENSALSGLYMSNHFFCTQCEANGFRRIMYYLDRPDVLARFSTTISADKKHYPVLLSNGNLIDQGETTDKHWVKWQDPFPKPAYLFALVAGHLECIEDSFTTQSGRTIALYFYVEAENKDKCSHAIDALKRAMAWDEKTYGREYDLDVYMVVAVNDFNMGAMENKGLNIFNAKYILANPKTATDQDYENIEKVVAHEYFHNWTGNRVTLRDWFQLSLKEGLTVFREQQYAADIFTAGVQRIDDVTLVRTAQFAEDAGPMSHPVRPASYIEMNNFYTVTVYEKGAELIRMIHTFLGQQTFRKAMDRYFDRYDGQAVTTDDFVTVMEEASQKDLSQFRRWYEQAGTPVVEAHWDYDETKHQLDLVLTQNTPPTPGQAHKEPLQMPIAMALFDKQGQQIQHKVLDFNQPQQRFIFNDIKQNPLPSLVRNFSAPVKLKVPYSDSDWAFLLTYESDDFSRWNAAQQMAVQFIHRLVESADASEELLLADYVLALNHVLMHSKLDKALLSKILSLPSENYLAETLTQVDVDNLVKARDFLKSSLAHALKQDLLVIYHENKGTEASFNPSNAAKRSLQNSCLDFLGVLDTPDIHQLCATQYHHAQTMTEQLGALQAINNSSCDLRNELLNAFYDQWRHDPLVVNKWLALQASSHAAETFSTLELLVHHEAFKLTNPNNVYALLVTFARNNMRHFHHISGRGYVFIADYVLTLDGINPQVAARLASSFNNWKHFDVTRQKLMQQQLVRISEKSALSKDVYEIVTKALEN